MSQDPPDPPAADLRLRTRPAPVLRLSRRALIVTSALTASLLAVAIGLALKSSGPKAETEPNFTLEAPPPEAVRALPADYRGPKLGPPLPGDLGGPILAAQQGPEPAAERPQAPGGSHGRDLEAARRSGIFWESASRSVHLGSTGTAKAEPFAQLTSGFAQAPAAPPAAASTVHPARLTAPASPNILQAGAIVPAALITGIRSDVPGQVVAQVSQPVFDTPTGKILLIPQGARLLGAYESRIAFGQRRVLLSWTRLILPGGRSIELGAEPAGDPQGFAGLQDRVDRRWGELFGMAALSTLLAAGAELGAEDEDDLVRAIRRGGADTFNQAGQQAVGRALDLTPRLTIRPGAPVRLILTRDLILEPYLEPSP